VKSLVLEWVQQVRGVFLRFVKKVSESLESGLNYQEFQSELSRELDALGREALRLVIEACDERLLEEPEARPGWVVARRGDRKRLLTVFGYVDYERTYFKHKASGRHEYLADRHVGVVPHQRIDVGLKGALVERAAERSYRKSGRWHEGDEARHVSGQTVMKAVHNAPIVPMTTRSSREKRKVEYLFIEADEDHVGNRSGARWQPRLVTVHEGREGPAWRRRLVNKRQFGGLYLQRTEELWHEVWRYLDETYELEEVAAILVSGDGAGWIRAGCEYIPGSVFVLDRYHAGKYVTQAAGGNQGLYGRMRRALASADRRELSDALEEAEREAQTASRREAIDEARRYFKRNWDGIAAWGTFRGVWPGCSAEGQVSHLYAARMSSRPMAWGRKGVEQMSRLRVMQANGVSIRQAYVREHTRGLPPLRLSARRLQVMRQALNDQSVLGGILFENVPALGGSSYTLRRALKSIIYGL